jgi:hypothetical protein
MRNCHRLTTILDKFMTDARFDAVSRPPLAIRVGVTGARNLTAAQTDALRPAVADILAAIARESARLAANPRAAAVYAPAPPALRLLSPLAEGADRLVAEEASKAGFTLFAPLPFPQADYEQDFPATLEAFRALLAKGETLELDGDRAAFAPDSYREVGRFVVRNCDLLIAIWDGAREHGAGAAAEIVRFAAQAHLPVWWIDATGDSNPPRLVESLGDLRHADPAAASQKLTRYLEHLLLPPEPPHPEHSGVFEWLAHHLRPVFGEEAAPLEDYLKEQPLASGFPWGAYAWLMNIVAPRPEGDIPDLAPPGSRAEQWWDAFYKSADGLSIAYGDRYRSSYVLIAMLAFVALAGAGLGGVLGHGAEFFVIGLEAAALLAIGGLVLAHHTRHWHEKWISYRLLAELCRKQYVLSSIGRALPGSAITRLSADPVVAADMGQEPAPRDAWVAWYFAAVLRAAPFAVGAFRTAKPYALTLARSLVDEQNAYHRIRGARNAVASRRLSQLGEIFFWATLLFGVLKLAAFIKGFEGAVAWSAALGICLSAASAAFVGIRAYSEFSLLVRQSAHMLRVLRETSAELDAIDADEPLASRDLGRAMYGLTISMMQDVSGWAQLFRIKGLEPGG